MPNKHNQGQVQLLTDKISKAQSVAIIDYSGTTVNEQVKLRKEVKAAGGEVLVTKNTLIDIALGRGKLKDSLEGMNAIVFSYEDPIAAIKALFQFKKDTEKLTIKQGYMDDKVLSASEVENLSKLPGKNELLGMLIGTIKRPGQDLVGVLQAGPRNLVYALKAIAEKK